MNIFVTDPDPVLSANLLDDQRLVKMVLETTQLLCTALHTKGIITPYKPNHINHPCSVWTRESKGNYEWLLIHWAALNKEYSTRYKRTHKCYELYDIVNNAYKDLPFSTENLTAFANCTIFKTEPNVHKAYRDCMVHKWTSQTKKPRWFGIEKDFQIELDKLSTL